MAACTARTSDAEKVDAGARPDGDTGTAPDPVAALRPFEEESRRAFDFAKPPSAETGLGADPWAIRRIASGEGARWVGILRGRSAVVLLDDDLHEIARVPAPRSTTGLAVAKNGDVLVVGELSPAVARFAVRGRTLVPLGEMRVPGALGLRDVAVSPGGAVWALDERGGRLVRLGADGKGGPGAQPRSIAIGHGASQVIATARHVIVDAVADHELVVIATDTAGVPLAREPLRIEHDGPIWGFDARETDAGLLVAAGGVEDHPLDRRGGFFGFVDSFVYAYRVGERTVEKLGAANVSQHGVVTPKAVAIDGGEGDRVDLFVTAYGSPTGLRLGLRGSGEPTVAAVALVPGIRALDRIGASSTRSTAMANPLLDAWVLLDERGLRVTPISGEPPRATTSRLGEALFFTSLMAPKNMTTGALSRFTCETCHFEGYIDGRTHHTGRGDIRATTKPLIGLVGNRPYFSRALDPDLASVSDAEFRVAGAGSETDPFFAIEPRDHSWLEHLGVDARVEPLELRRALMRFLADLSHRPNPAVVGRTTFEASEREGARLFRDRCESCHASRLSADDPNTHVAFERWEAMILDEAGPIVWGSAGYQKTGITPYVHPEGARTPSLRRLYKKFPYFTNGSAKSTDDVLDSVRFVGPTMLHANALQGAQALEPSEKRALRAFLELL